MVAKGRALIIQWGPALLWMGLIFLLSSRTPEQLPNFGPFDLLVKKGSHAVGYAVLGMLLWWALRMSRRPFLWALLGAAVYALSDEWRQTFVPGRRGSLVDVLIDSLGALVGLLLLRWHQRRAPRPPDSGP